MHTHGKVAVVTGAGTGIGKAVAQILLRNNYAVTLTGRRQELPRKPQPIAARIQRRFIV